MDSVTDIVFIIVCKIYFLSVLIFLYATRPKLPLSHTFHSMAFNVRQNSTFEFCLYFQHLQFVLTSAIQHSSLQFLYSNCRFDIVSRFNIVVWCIQHSHLRNSTSKFSQFNIQLWKMHVFNIQRNTVNDSQCGLRNYQNSHLVGPSKGRSLCPRQQLSPRKMESYFILVIPNTLSYVSNVFVSSDISHSYI